LLYLAFPYHWSTARAFLSFLPGIIMGDIILPLSPPFLQEEQQNDPPTSKNNQQVGRSKIDIDRHDNNI
jgi:hypothetical protein